MICLTFLFICNCQYNLKQNLTVAVPAGVIYPIPGNSVAKTFNVLLKFRRDIVAKGADTFQGLTSFHSLLKGSSLTKVQIFSNLSSAELSGSCLIAR